MKIARFIQIAIYAIVFMIVGGLIYQALFESGGGRGRGFGYGNLWIQYSMKERGILEPRVEWLIVTPVFPKKQTYRGAGEWTFSFENGQEFSFSPDSKSLIWVDPDSGAKKISTEVNEDLIQRIDQSEESASGNKFNTGEEFLSWLEEQPMQNTP